MEVDHHVVHFHFFEPHLLNLHDLHPHVSLLYDFDNYLTDHNDLDHYTSDSNDHDCDVINPHKDLYHHTMGFYDLDLQMIDIHDLDCNAIYVPDLVHDVFDFQDLEIYVTLTPRLQQLRGSPAVQKKCMSITKTLHRHYIDIT